MRKIIYYVASSLDGYIAGENGDISGFVYGGNGVEKYKQDLQNFDTVIMGRNTYEFGYQYGLNPGQLAYPHMEHYIFSNQLIFRDQHPKVHVKKCVLSEIEAIQGQKGGDIYLCGGGKFAGWLLDHGKIDILKIKLNPLVLGKGIRLFGESKKNYQTSLISQERYDGGLMILTYSFPNA
ncbi:MAG: dihydrofolate reductase [Cyclobacteriaceae bacterium]|nr:dihydrofolate reductase [Cyclobacteriaceae bacterium]